MEEFFVKKHHRHVKEIPLAPILDLLVVVIFFLILSSSFIDLTKQTLPPSAVSTISNPVAPPPVSPKIFATKTGKAYRVFLRWSGEHAGQEERRLSESEDVSVNADQLVKAASELEGNFKKSYGTQSSIELGFSAGINYQDMVSVMDGVRDKIQDIVLVSYRETEALDKATVASESNDGRSSDGRTISSAPNVPSSPSRDH